MKTKAYGAMMAAVVLGGCSSMPNLLNVWGSGPSEQPLKQLSGATRYQCDGGRQFAVHYDAQGKSAMIIFPEREFRLDATVAASGARYTNGRTTLITRGDEASLEETGAAPYANCKRVTA